MTLEISSLRIQLVFTGLTEDNFKAFKTGLATKLGNISIPGVTFEGTAQDFNEETGKAEVPVTASGTYDDILDSFKAIVNGAEAQFHEVDHGGGIHSTMFRGILDVRPEEQT